VRSAVGRARGLVLFLVLAVSAGWVLLRRRSSAASLYVAPVGSDAGRDARPDAGRDASRAVPATDAGLAGEPASAVAPAAPAAPAEEKEPGGPGEVPGDVLATDAGLTAEPAADAVPAADAADAVPAADAADAADAVPAVPPADAVPAAKVAASEATTAEPAAADNLRALRGIGPSTESLLHDLGITTYRQIAALEGDELERVRAALPEFRTRIEREDWMGQARELHREKYGETL